MSIEPGTLLVVATPIGNLKDITIRAVEALEKADLIAAEDTRHTRKLLAHLDIRKKMTSCNEHNESEKIENILKLLQEGRTVALVSDAGTPGLSDPGARLVAAVRARGLDVIPVPGPSAIAAALSVSGFPGSEVYFAGFLPSRHADRVKRLKALAGMEVPMVYYEAPHRLLKTLKDMLSILGDRKIFLAREMTKRHETYIFSTVSGLLAEFQGRAVKGEITLIVEGSREKSDNMPDMGSLTTVIESMMTGSRMPVKQLSAVLSRLTGISRGKIYSMALEFQESQAGGKV